MVYAIIWHADSRKIYLRNTTDLSKYLTHHISCLHNWRKTANEYIGKIHWTFINGHSLKTTMAECSIQLQRVYYFFFLILKTHLNCLLCLDYCLMEGKTCVCLFFSLQSVTSTDFFGTSKNEMERLEEELKKWKASSVKHTDWWKLAERYLEDL